MKLVKSKMLMRLSDKTCQRLCGSGNVIFTIEGLFHKMLKTKCLKKVYPSDFDEVSTRLFVLVGNCASWCNSPVIFLSTLNSCLLTCYLTNLCSVSLSSFLISNISLNVALQDRIAYGNHIVRKGSVGLRWILLDMLQALKKSLVRRKSLKTNQR